MNKLLLITLLLGPVLSGCSPSASTTDLQSFVDNVLSKPRGRVEPIPSFKTYEFFSYSASSMRSPFVLPVVPEKEIALAANELVKPNTNRPKEFLENFALGDLNMVGTLQKPSGELWALIKDGSGGVTRVRNGYFMGQNHGQIISISSQRIDLVEIVPNGMGGWIERPRTIAINGLAGE